MRNELTSAEFALNLDGAGGGGINGQARGGSSGSAKSSSSSSTASPPGSATAAGGSSGSDSGSSSSTSSKVEIDFDSYAERLEGSLRALQAGRPLALLEAVSEDEVR